MTFRETFNKFKKQNDKEKLTAFYDKYSFLFNIPAHIVTNEIISAMKKNNKTIKANAVYQVEGNLYELKNKPEEEKYNNTISTSIAIKEKYETKHIHLSKNSSATSLEELQLGSFNINIFEILLNDNFEDAETIHLSCWKAMATHLKQTVTETSEKSL